MRIRSAFAVASTLVVMLVTVTLLMVDPHPSFASEDAVIIGAMYNLTGSQSALDIPSSEGALLAAKQANSTGGVLGRTVDVIVRDGETKPSVIVERMAALLTDYPTVSAFIGLSDTDMLAAAEPVAAAAKRVFLTSGASSPKLPSEEPTYLFLACFGDNVQAAAAAEWAYNALGARSAAVLFNREMEYTRLLHGYFATRFEELGGMIASTTGYEPAAISDSFKGVADADIIFLSAGPADAVAGVPELRKAGFNQPIIGGDGFDSDGWQSLPDLSNVYFTTHAYLGEDNTDPKVVAFRKAFSEMYPGKTADSFAALGYDAVDLLLAAVRRAGSAAPDKVLAALAETHDFQGVTGTLSYEDGQRIPKKSVAIIGIKDGKYSLASEVLPSAVPPP